MPERAEPLEPSARAELLLQACERAASDLVSGAASLGLLIDAKPGRRELLQGEARHLFVFVVLSVLLEEGRRPETEALKDLFARQLLETRRQAQALIARTLKGGEAKELSRKLDEAGRADPFAPYYGSWEAFKKDPAKGPFARFAQSASDRCFEPPQRAAARERLNTLALSLADALLDGISRG